MSRSVISGSLLFLPYLTAHAVILALMCSDQLKKKHDLNMNVCQMRSNQNKVCVMSRERRRVISTRKLNMYNSNEGGGPGSKESPRAQSKLDGPTRPPAMWLQDSSKGFSKYIMVRIRTTSHTFLIFRRCCKVSASATLSSELGRWKRKLRSEVNTSSATPCKRRYGVFFPGRGGCGL